MAKNGKNSGGINPQVTHIITVVAAGVIGFAIAHHHCSKKMHHMMKMMRRRRGSRGMMMACPVCGGPHHPLVHHQEGHFCR